jgi:hypothetical protein
MAATGTRNIDHEQIIAAFPAVLADLVSPPVHFEFVPFDWEVVSAVVCHEWLLFARPALVWKRHMRFP